MLPSSFHILVSKSYVLVTSFILHFICQKEISLLSSKNCPRVKNFGDWDVGGGEMVLMVVDVIADAEIVIIMLHRRRKKIYIYIYCLTANIRDYYIFITLNNQQKFYCIGRYIFVPVIIHFYFFVFYFALF